MAGAELLERPVDFMGNFTFDEKRFFGFAALRSAAWDMHRRLGIPTIKDEEWKYTSLRELTSRSFSPAPATELESSDLDPFDFPGLDAYRMVFVNGRYAEALSSPQDSLAGVEIRSLAQLANDDPDRLQGHLGSLAPIDQLTFAAMNTALFEDGAWIHILPGAKPDRPIHIIHAVAGAGEFASFPRNLILAGEGSESFVIESYVSVGAVVGFSNVVSEVLVERNARLEHVKVQRENRASFHIALTQVKLREESTLVAFNVNFGGKIARNDLNVFLDGSHVHCRIDGAIILDGDQHCDNHTRIDHALPNCDSFEVYKHVLNGHSTAVFNGKIYVHQDAQKTDAKQTNQTLLLSPTATIYSKPQLEIFADDVKCTHGATIGQLREDALFYLRSRGLSEQEAKAMLVYAFAADVLEKISDEHVRSELERLLYVKLGEGQ